MLPPAGGNKALLTSWGIQEGFFGVCDELMNLFYAATITATSVGYGDYYFGTQLGRGLGALYAVLGVVVASNFIGGVSGYVVFVEQEKIIREHARHLSLLVMIYWQVFAERELVITERKLKKKLTVKDIIAMDDDGDGQVDRLEFLTKMVRLSLS